jgi:hydroxyethylthiazole kinase-like uncharacterized protein yjeF
MNGPELLTVAEMSEADRLAVKSGVPSLTLMENAGWAVANCVERYYPGKRVIVLCGPGNNGGDGFVAARLLKERSRDVRLGLLGDSGALRGDAAIKAQRWDGLTSSVPGALKDLNPDCVVVDALFGAGLTRPLGGEALDAAVTVYEQGVPVVAVDIPSGTHGDTGRVLGEDVGSKPAGFRAERTVTFFRKKLGHVLFPGRKNCGQIEVADIGIPGEVLRARPAPSAESGRARLVDVRPPFKARVFENGPAVWGTAFPRPHPQGHKYDRGHVVVVSGPAHATGAARLAARGALRIGAGLVSVASPRDAVVVNAAHLTAIMIKPIDGVEALAALLEDKRINAVVLGPGLGANETTRKFVEAVLRTRVHAVLDADALTSFADNPRTLIEMLHEGVVLTPHEGEFERLFPDLLEGSASRLEAARAAADAADCVVLLKGPDTVIASPKSGRAAINTNAPAWLATAGSGDVLAGFVGGLLAQAGPDEGISPFEAACAAVWLHGEAAAKFGVGLVAEDLPETLPQVLRGLTA